MNLFAELLGKQGAFLPVVESVVTELRTNHCRYEFLAEPAFRAEAEHSVAAFQRVYWREMLYRAHLAAGAGLLRAAAWIDAGKVAAEVKNPLAFAACLRGFVESSADTWHGLRGIALFLAEDRDYLTKAVTGKATEPVVAPQIQGQLIHFLYARRVSRADKPNVPDSHSAKHMQDYLESFGSEYPSVQSLYAELCELAHPAKASLDLFQNTLPDGTIELRPCGGERAIRQLAQKHDQALPTLFGCGINPPLQTLKVLNELPIEKLHSPSLANIDFKNIPTGARIGQLLGKRF